MARVTVNEVHEVVDTELEYDQVTACIAAANVIVSRTCAASTNPSLTAAELKEIERWLAAHFVCIRDPRELRSSLHDAEAWFFPAAVTTAWGKGLNLTPYGQQAIALDFSGQLANLSKQRASFRVSPRENSNAFTEGQTTD